MHLFWPQWWVLGNKSTFLNTFRDLRPTFQYGHSSYTRVSQRAPALHLKMHSKRGESLEVIANYTMQVVICCCELADAAIMRARIQPLMSLRSIWCQYLVMTEIS